MDGKRLTRVLVDGIYSILFTEGELTRNTRGRLLRKSGLLLGRAYGHVYIDDNLCTGELYNEIKIFNHLFLLTCLTSAHPSVLCDKIFKEPYHYQRSQS